MRVGAAIAAALLALGLGAAAAKGPGKPYWLGRTYKGLHVTATTSHSYVYGSCQPVTETGCSAPYEVQHHTTCERNPLALDITPERVFRFRRGAIAASYPEGDVDVGTGRYTVTVFATTTGRAVRAVRALRRRSQHAPSKRLAAPVYPTAVLQELKRVVLARARWGDVGRIARETGLPREAVQTRLALARLLGSKALAKVTPPSQPWPTVAQERQVAMFAWAQGVGRAARQFGLSQTEVRATMRRVRGLTGRC
jgi:hypothetical protein